MALDKKVMDSHMPETVEVVTQSPTGPRTYLSTKTPWYNSDGEVIGLIGISHDITDRKNMEMQLVRQAEELRIADQNKSVFLSTLSHELRNPLATIVAGISLLDISEVKEQQERAKQIIKRQTAQLTHLVDDLLDMTRITRNKIALNKENVELNGLAASVADEYQMLFDEKQIQFDSNIQNDPIYIDADPVRIKQIIGNLLHNALKFTHPGGEVGLRVDLKGSQTAVIVKDSGKGIDPKFLPGLFAPFNQADIAIDRRDGGLGLGLSIVKGIAKLHGGSVRACSEGPGKGSEFTIFLPAVNQGCEEAE
jgi:signal transduction histidine kinase